MDKSILAVLYTARDLLSRREGGFRHVTKVPSPDCTNDQVKISVRPNWLRVCLLTLHDLFPSSPTGSLS